MIVLPFKAHLVLFFSIVTHYAVANHRIILQVFSCFGQYFCLHFEAFQLGMAPVYIAFLRFIGDDAEAKELQLQPGGWRQWS